VSYTAPLLHPTDDVESDSPTEIVQFRTLLSDLLEKKASPLTAIPDEHLPVVAKLVHERYLRFNR
jgi:hypothetical protein